MADNNDLVYKAGFDFDEKDIDKVVQKIEQKATKAFSKVKPLELPVSASTKFKVKDENNKKEQKRIDKLNEAQSKLLNHWNKQFEKGFKSSVEYNQKTQELYNTFKKLSKSRADETQTKEIINIIGKAVKNYSEEVNNQYEKQLGITRKEFNLITDAWSKGITNLNKILGKKRAGELIDNRFFEKYKKASPGRKATSTRLSTWKTDEIGVEDDKGNKELLRKNDRLGTYFGKNSLMKQWAQARQEEYKKTKASLKKYNVRDFSSSEHIKALFENSHNKYDYKDTTGKNVSYANIAKVGGDLMGKTPDITTDDLGVQIAHTITRELASTDFQDILPALKRSLTGASSELMNRFKDGGIVGVNYGEEGEYKGVGVNYERWKEAVESIFKGFDNINIDQLRETFGSVRNNLTQILNGIRTDKRNIEDKIFEYKKQIEDNKKNIESIDTTTAKEIKSNLSAYKKQLKSAKATLVELTKEQSNTSEEIRTTKDEFKKVKEKYKDEYEQLEKQAKVLQEQANKIPDDLEHHKEWKDAYGKYLEVQQQVWDHPYNKEESAYNAKIDPLQQNVYKLGNKIRETEKIINSTSKKIAQATKQLELAKNTTKEERQQRITQIKKLEEENKQLQKNITQLKARNTKLSKKETIANKELYDSNNYQQVETILRQILMPLVNGAFGGTSDKGLKDISNSIKRQTNLEELRSDRQDVLQNKQVKEAQNTVGQIEDETDIVQTDAGTGLNTDSNLSLMLNALTSINDTLTNILKDIKNINNGGNNRKGGGNKKGDIPPYQAQLMLPPPSGKPDYVDDTKIYNSHFKEDKTDHNKLLEKYIDFGKIQTASIQGVELKKVFNGVLDKLKSILSGSVSAAEEAMTANEQKQKELLAERMRLFGVSDTYSNPSKTGTKTNLSYIRDLWNGFRGKKPTNIFEDIQLSKGIEIDTTNITQAMQKVIERSQFKAQTGGVLSNVMMAGTGGLAGFFLPSIEKTRTQIEGLNAIMGDTRSVFGQVIQTIQDRALKLQALQESGQAKFDDKGNLIKALSTPEAQFLVKDLEESKSKLRGILADISAVDQVIQTSHGRVGTILKRISFLSPELRKNNVAVQNLNAGLTKGGKALKFQTRMGEILNYTFQLMGRSVGQMLKSWMQQLNPITQIKKAFSDFQGYNVKWQRTMNVIKYNIRAVLRPFMDWVAQKLVNIIGFVDIISTKVQEAFGKIPISLFDQAAAESEKIHEELEAAANVTAGFDELHDIGSDNSGANDLMGEIYTPHLSEKWKELAERIGNLFAGVIKGDLGFGEAVKEILGIALQGIGTLWSEIIKPFLTNTLWPFIKDGFWDLLGTLLKYYLGWKLLKVAGKLLWDALTGHFTVSAFGGLLGKVGGWISADFSSIIGAILEKGGFGSQLIVGFEQMFHGQGLIGAIKNGGASLGSVFAQAFTAIAGVTLATKLIGYFGNKADQNSAYNQGLIDYGGNEKDKKSNFGNGLGATLGGAAGGALTGLALGGPIGAAIGAGIGGIAGLLRTTLSPAIEATEIAARNMNNEMQKIEYYEGAVQGAKTALEPLNELLDVSNKLIETRTQKVYEEGEALGISKIRMDELVTSIQEGTFSTDMLSSSELGLQDSLLALSQAQEKNEETTKRVTEAKKKLEKAEMDLAIAQDVSAGNFELAAARIELAEASELYTETEATAKRIQLYKQTSEEQRKNLLQDLTPEQRKLMLNYNNATDKELAELVKLWRNSSEDVKQALLQGVDSDTVSKFGSQMDKIDDEINKHKGFWQGAGDTLKEIFTFGIADTWTYNTEVKAVKESKKVKGHATGTNYVASDGLAYIHQGEAIVPKKYNPALGNQTLTPEEREYMSQMIATMKSLDNTMQSGIPITGEFKQRGSDLVAVVQKGQNRNGNQPLSNPAYAR